MKNDELCDSIDLNGELCRKERGHSGEHTGSNIEKFYIICNRCHEKATVGYNDLKEKIIHTLTYADRTGEIIGVHLCDRCLDSFYKWRAML